MKAKLNKEKMLNILTAATFILSVLSLALGSSLILIISATLMAVCILLSFIEKGKTHSSDLK